MTAHALKADRLRCLNAGMDQYIAKPIRAEQLFDTIGLVLRDASVGDWPDPSQAAEKLKADWAQALRAVGGDRDLLQTLIEAVLEESPGMIEAIRRSIADRDGPGLQNAAHILKGSIRYFGAEPIFERLFRLERMGRDEDLEEAEELFEGLKGEMGQFESMLRDYLHREDAATGGE
jgi:HPt (histidine-containing phosphotransfer) domain-containing protein